MLIHRKCGLFLISADVRAACNGASCIGIVDNLKKFN